MRIGFSTHGGHRARSALTCFGLAMLWCCAALAAQPHANKEYCASDGTNLMFAIDVTTAYDPKDKELLVRAVSEIFDSLRGGERVVIRSITSSFASSDRLIDTCIPVCAATGMLDELFKCSQGLIVSDTRRVKQEIVRALTARLEGVKDEPLYDIVRTLCQIAREEGQRGRRKILYIFSDLIENSETVNTHLFFETENGRLIRYLKKRDLIARLEGVEVRAFGVGRGNTQDRLPLPVARYQKLIDFWNLYFTDAKAASAEISQNIVEHGR
jgi:hypothetical protein